MPRGDSSPRGFLIESTDMKTRLATIILMGMLALGMPHAHAAEDLAKLSILKQPAQLIAGIYQAFHDWQVDAGIAVTDKALAELDGPLRQNPEMELADPNLKTKKLKQVASSLHTLLGMLDQRKALKLLDEEGKRKNERMEKLADNKMKLDQVDLERRLAIEKESAQLSVNAINEFRTAIRVDPANPSPHFELAKAYAQGLPGSGTGAAEEEYYQAAACALGEGDVAAARSAIVTLAALNPKSKYIAQFEERIKTGNKSR